MTRPNRSMSLALVLAGSTAVTAPAIAHAESDLVIQPNSACQWTKQTDVPLTAEHSVAGIIHHDEAVFRQLSCGIDRFNLTNTNGLRDLDLRATTTTPGPKDLECAAYSFRPDGSLVKLVKLTTTIDGPTRPDWNGALNQSVAYGSYAVACTMPADVLLINILQREY